MKRFDNKDEDDGKVIIFDVENERNSLSVKVIGEENHYAIIPIGNNLELKVGEWTISTEKRYFVYSTSDKYASLIFDTVLRGEIISLQLLILLDTCIENNENEKPIELSPKEIIDYLTQSFDKLVEQNSVPNMLPVVENKCWLKKYPV